MATKLQVEQKLNETGQFVKDENGNVSPLVLSTNRVGIGGSISPNPEAANLEVNAPYSDWIFLRQVRDKEGGGGFHIHNPWANSNETAGQDFRNRLEIGYRTPDGVSKWCQFIIHGPTGNVGIGTVPTEKLTVDGNILATGDVQLAGADCAEEFDVEADQALDPGTVMVIGNEDKLGQCTETYDKRVAGVLSGAGDYKPGIVLDKQQSPNKRLPLALSGKVFCKVGADQAAIEVGDLLTTSPTPGHAMKADDPLKAFGAVIGKALRPLAEGQGLVPILIALH